MKTGILRVIAALLLGATLLSGCNKTVPTETKPAGTTANTTTPTTAGATTAATEPTEVTTVPTEPATIPTEAATIPTEPTTAPTEPTTAPTEPITEVTQPGECAHQWSAWTIQTEATCEQDGLQGRSCAACGKQETQAITASHKWDEGTVTKAPGSCSETGVKTFTCAACGKTKAEELQGNHSFSQWEYEEYTYEAYNAAGRLTTYTSHRKVRTCTKCGYKETGGTPDHICTYGCKNHTETVIEEATCTKGALYRSTCNICGWHEDYRSDETGDHSWKSETRHLTDYGDYTNELDARISTCTVCGTKTVSYTAGEGWSNYNRYRNSISFVGEMYAMNPQSNNFNLVDHPSWQTVTRNVQYDSDGYVKQFTLYWWYNGSRYSQVIKCGEGEIEAWFAEYGISVSGNISGYTLYCTGTKLVPYKIAYTG